MVGAATHASVARRAENGLRSEGPPGLRPPGGRKVPRQALASLTRCQHLRGTLPRSRPACIGAGAARSEGRTPSSSGDATPAASASGPAINSGVPRASWILLGEVSSPCRHSGVYTPRHSPRRLTRRLTRPLRAPDSPSAGARLALGARVTRRLRAPDSPSVRPRTRRPWARVHSPTALALRAPAYACARGCRSSRSRSST
jgi:hypothetical protein